MTRTDRFRGLVPALLTTALLLPPVAATADAPSEPPHEPTSTSGVQEVTRKRIYLETMSEILPKVDGKVVDTKKMAKTLPMILQWDEAFDIGSDTLTGVNDADYKPPFELTAKLNKLTIKVDRPQLSKADIEKLEKATRNNSSSE